ncbi:MAG: hypothetical protein ABR568_20400, partial [Pyrinomonadaceae bacterium]
MLISCGLNQFLRLLQLSSGPIVILTVMFALSSVSRATHPVNRTTPLGTTAATPHSVGMTGDPLLMTEENSSRAIALDTITWQRDPFPLTSPDVLGQNQRTRVMLFATNLSLMPGVATSAITADAEDGMQRVYPLVVEHIIKVPNFDWIRGVVIKLNDDLGAGEVQVRIYQNGVASNRVYISIKPPAPSYSIAASSSGVSAGSPIGVTWNISSNQSQTDWVGLYRVGSSSADGNEQWWRYTGGSPRGNLTLNAPLQGGQYEFRLFLNNTFARVASSNSVTVASAPTPNPTPTPVPTPNPSPTPPPTSGAQFYVSPSGSSSGDGSQANPWDLVTAMNHPAAVRPGDTIYLRAGTYRLDLTSEPDTTFWSLTGTAGAPITVRAYPGERAIIDIDHRLSIFGNYTHYVGLELMCSRPSKVVQSGWSPDRPGSVGFVGRGLKLINCILHDLIDLTAFKDAIDFEMYGNVMYYFGSMGNLDRPTGTTGYIQNEVGTKVITDNLMLSSCQHLVMLYGSDAAYLKNIQFEGNTLMNAGSLSGMAGFNIVAWVGQFPSENISIVDNYSYTEVPDPGSNAVFWGAGGVVNQGLKITGNHFIGGSPVLRIGVWNPATITNNTLYGTNG